MALYFLDGVGVLIWSGFIFQVFPVLWQLVQGDMATMWEVAPLFHTRCKREAILSCPLQVCWEGQAMY